MTTHDIRVLDDESDHRAAHTLFRRTLHRGPAPDGPWAFLRDAYEPGRALGAYGDGGLVGTVQSFPSSLAVPGGAVVPMSAVSRVGVRADWTRRGVLTALQRVQLRSFRERGDVAATLRASEAGIYGRYGYGVASRFRKVTIDRLRMGALPKPTGRVRSVSAADGTDVLREIFEQVSPVRPGTIGRWPGWWAQNYARVVGTDEEPQVAVRSGESGDDGYVAYVVDSGGHDDGEDRPATLTVADLWARTPEAWVDLWLFVLGVDLVRTVTAADRPVDEPLEWLVGDRRAVRTVDVVDETWLRLVDVPEALARRTYAPVDDTVVLGVRDAFLPENDGAYVVGRSGVERTSAAPELVLDVDRLGSVYLGDLSFADAAAARRVEVVDPTAPARADRLFATAEVPWCGTFF
ncbi:GNAT family N-acetyltransferase [Saccharothrix violaceirubra]|uniref:Putative acetyltransferase n=1 Tax=Saccharothrix violaceirubra TaxID=413306 RepID=A0A7W7T1T3_9PSEU|nr:GNAT family N-acetyltransferase [Saccharothrix violaceirubra]MBB4965002.1 putative acetyltransferase [Saccharothrix violaceirubra]